METRYSFGGDDHIFVEVDEEMSLDAFFKSLSMTSAVRESRIKGVTEICPANASYQIRFDPGLISPNDMLAELKRLESAAEKSDRTLSTRILEVPVYYNDPWTHETLMRFRERHQDPSGTDLEYAARINGYAGVPDFIQAHSGAPWFVSMVGFGQADRGAEIPAAEDRHAEAHGWPRRLFRLHLLGSRGRRLSAFRRHADAHL
jgi:urea carboxylase